jgi:hypothetical protein
MEVVMPIGFIHMDSEETETTESFFSNQLIKARIKSENHSNQDYDPIFEENRSEEWNETHWSEIKQNDLNYDEDVNQYITLTLAEMATPQNLSLTNQYVVGIESDVGQIAINLDQKSQKYKLYRVNADFLLFHLGLFSRESNILGDAYFDKGESYYHYAASSLKAAHGGKSGLSDVLEKLSSKFGTYVEVLRCMKNQSENFFSFHFNFSNEEIQTFQEQLTGICKIRKDMGAS